MLLPVTLTQEPVCRYIRQGNEPVGRREAQPRQRRPSCHGRSMAEQRTDVHGHCLLPFCTERMGSTAAWPIRSRPPCLGDEFLFHLITAALEDWNPFVFELDLGLAGGGDAFHAERKCESEMLR
ncbi:hypothetical protein V8C43DRAFT_267566 [Trichoderma afarasin]